MKTFIFNLLTNERRLAILENKKVVEFLIERPEINKIIGNVYKGKIVNVLPGMQAAFVDIGLDKNGFLYRDELVSYQLLDEPDEEKKQRSISQFVTVGQEILVQVTKEGFGKKGPRLTEIVSFPGKYIVYLPNGGYVGVSKRMETEEIREQWRKVGAELLQSNEGMIIRTVTEQLTEEKVAQELFFLRKLWTDTWNKGKGHKPPTLIYEDVSILERIIRDFSFEDVEEIVIDSLDEFLFMKEMFKPYPELESRLTFYRESESVFSAYGIESELDKALRKQVWLKNGAYLVIEQTEALTVIDVNTGKFTGKLDLRDTIVKTNIEAAKEIARQLRLRDIGGIIIIDFIDMRHNEDRKAVIREFNHLLKRDRTKTNLIGFTELGLVEMTRKKVRHNLLDSVSMPCPTCYGKGKILSDETVAHQIERALREYKQVEEEAVLIEVSPQVRKQLIGDKGERLTILEHELGFKLFVHPNENLAPEKFEIRHFGKVEDIQAKLAKM